MAGHRFRTTVPAIRGGFPVSGRQGGGEVRTPGGKMSAGIGAVAPKDEPRHRPTHSHDTIRALLPLTAQAGRPQREDN
ncbi:hypothetical protein GE300_04575 [Rhodobacteraceae bacterium 2CG4]|uniref:Uncharacterized protein n=1 Tax=Halovulum marinum TaxID=2662447 RepID=A0A6L5YXD6_9RHOB|nr:hypothetical protein [Halovulum marinum]MSU88897.1 hypothetical protein [Halovulum marinum]